MYEYMYSYDFELCSFRYMGILGICSLFLENFPASAALVFLIHFVTNENEQRITTQIYLNFVKNFYSILLFKILTMSAVFQSS